MSWREFRELFMGKFFPASSRQAKAREFLDLKQRDMTVLNYIAKFTELARFEDEFVATDLAKVRKFEDGLKFLLQDMDSMVKTTMTIKREIDYARSIRATGTREKRKDQPSSSSGKRQRTSTP